MFMRVARQQQEQKQVEKQTIHYIEKNLFAFFASTRPSTTGTAYEALRPQESINDVSKHNNKNTTAPQSQSEPQHHSDSDANTHTHYQHLFFRDFGTD
eukprot:m.120802 g.120802  ORF g.120802 m.120802 type:complete len:98 (-) comp12916_c0_seq104:815-1108(-)